MLGSSSSSGKQPRDYLPDFATLNAQSTRHGARRDPNLRRGVQAGPLRAPQPRAREEIREKRANASPSQKVHSNIYEHVVVEHHQISSNVPQAQNSAVNPHKPQSKYAPIRARQRKQADRVGSSQHAAEPLDSSLCSQNERRSRGLPGLHKCPTIPNVA